MNSKKLVARVEKGDGWRSGRGGGGFQWKGFEWRALGWHMALGEYERVTPHGPSEVTVEEVRIVNHFPAVKTEGQKSSQARGSGANQMSGNERVSVLLRFSPTTSSGTQKPDEWMESQGLEESQACKGFWEALVVFLGQFNLMHAQWGWRQLVGIDRWSPGDSYVQGSFSRFAGQRHTWACSGSSALSPCASKLRPPLLLARHQAEECIGSGPLPSPPAGRN